MSAWMQWGYDVRQIAVLIIAAQAPEEVSVEKLCHKKSVSPASSLEVTYRAVVLKSSTSRDNLALKH